MNIPTAYNAYRFFREFNDDKILKQRKAVEDKINAAISKGKCCISQNGTLFPSVEKAVLDMGYFVTIKKYGNSSEWTISWDYNIESDQQQTQTSLNTPEWPEGLFTKESEGG